MARAGTIVHDAAIVATGLAMIRLGGLALFRAILPAAGVRTSRIVEDIALVARLRRLGNAAAAAVGARSREPRDDLRGDHGRDRVRHAGHAGQRAGRPVPRARQVDRDRGLDQARRPLRARRPDPLAPHRHPHAQRRARHRAEQHAHEVALRGDRQSGCRTGPLAPLDLVRRREPRAARRGCSPRPDQALAGAEIPNVAREPRPSCVLMEFGAGHCRYALRYWLTDPEVDDPTDTAVRTHLLASLARAGIAACHARVHRPPHQGRAGAGGCAARAGDRGAHGGAARRRALRLPRAATSCARSPSASSPRRSRPAT